MNKNNCKLCNSGEKTLVAKQEFEDPYLTIINSELNKINRSWVECNNCNLIYHDPQLEESELKLLYENFRDVSFRNETPDDYFDRITSLPISESENHFKVEWLIDNIPNHLAKGGAILDIGSGGGVYLYTFLQKNLSWTPFCIEPTPVFAEIASRKLNCPVHIGNYSRGIFNRKFDLIICNQVLEHVINPISFLADIYSDMSKGGYLYIEVPDSIDFKNLLPKHDRFMAQHLWYFSKFNSNIVLII